MNDEMKGKSGKVKVMYVRSDDDSDKRTHNPRTGKGGGRPGKSRADGGRRPARDDKQSQPRDRKWEESPWRTVSRAPGDETPEKADHGGISGKSFIDPEVLRRQRAEETPRLRRKCLSGTVPEPSGSDCSRLVYPECNAAF